MKQRFTIGAIIGSTLLASAATFVAIRVGAAGIPAKGTLTYTGYLESDNGTPVTTEQMIGLGAYDSFTAGARVCEVEAKPITPIGGRFQIPLPDTCVAAVSANPELWVEVYVAGIGLGRTKLGAVPYAVEAGHAMKADSASTAASAMVAETAKAIAAGPIGGGLMHYEVPGAALAAPCLEEPGFEPLVVCTCPSGNFVVSGGAYISRAGCYIAESRPLDTTRWLVKCASSEGAVRCDRYNLLCSRLGP